jgi:RHS repeat-associated protein
MRGYVYQGGSLLAVQQGGVFWMHEDPVTKSKRVTDVNGSVVSAIELDPWGADTNRSGNQYFQPKRFTSYERDGNGSDEGMFRRYNRWHSRFDQPDPYDGSYKLDDPQSFNRYAYVQNDPVNHSDPTGLMPCIEMIDPATGQSTCVQGGTWTVTVRDGGPSPIDDPTTFAFVRNSRFGGFGGSGGFGGGGRGGPQKPSPTPPAQPLPPNYRPPKDLEQPCMDRTNEVLRDIKSIARTLHGKATSFQTAGRFPGGRIDPRGQSFGTAVGRLTSNGFVPATVLGFQSFDHPEGESFQKQFNDGLWHVIVNYPRDPDNSKLPTPLITAHCHATDPTGATHIIDRLFGP